MATKRSKLKSTLPTSPLSLRGSRNSPVFLPAKSGYHRDKKSCGNAPDFSRMLGAKSSTQLSTKVLEIPNYLAAQALTLTAL
jgi:hypothetical protein